MDESKKKLIGFFSLLIRSDSFRYGNFQNRRSWCLIRSQMHYNSRSFRFAVCRQKLICVFNVTKKKSFLFSSLTFSCSLSFVPNSNFRWINQWISNVYMNFHILYRNFRMECMFYVLNYNQTRRNSAIPFWFA